MTAYYNENDPYAAEWLRNLIAAGHIAPGVVDDRSIVEVTGAELATFDQCHFFAGIGGWSLALRFAGWPDDRPVWTGSCPCQPFSAAGKGLGERDERHLWPVWFRLIAECRPAVVFGEQVEGAVKHGWLDGVCTDLEGEGYAVGAAVLGAHSVGAPHIRQRLWWVADFTPDGRQQVGADGRRSEERSGQEGGPAGLGLRGAPGGGMGIPPSSGRAWRGDEPEHIQPMQAGAWGSTEWIACADGKARRIEPSIEPLAHGVPNRVGRLRAFGNAIVPSVAAQFIKAFQEAQQ